MPLSQLNAQQLEAARAPFGKNLIIASAGTGKTSTIVGRIAYLLQQNVNPEHILLLTFTNKAAAEMINRLKRFFPANLVEKIEAGTFHAISYRWLKKYNPKVALKQPNELKTLFKSIYEKRSFFRLNFDIEPFSANYLYELYILFQNRAQDSFEEWFLQRFKEQKVYIDIYMDIIDEFEATKKEYNFLSFNDLLLEAIKLVQNEPIYFEEVLVDEYQDTNNLQEKLITSINAKSLFCVGDYDQSIYAFNGANIKNIALFSKRFPDANIFTLSVNYRSSKPILQLANKVIQNNERIYPKKLEVGKKGKEIPPKLLIYDTLIEQYHSIAKMIKQSNTSYEEIAIIFRNNSSADGLEASLRELNIPCKRKGSRSFFEAREIKVILDILTLINNPKDLMAFIHIFEYAKGVGAALAKDIFSCLTHFGEGNLIDGVISPKREDLPQFNKVQSKQLALFDDFEEFFSKKKDSFFHPIAKLDRINDEALDFFEKFYFLLKELNTYQQTPFYLIQKVVSSKLFDVIVQHLSIQRAKLKSGEIDKEKKEEAKKRIYYKAKLLLELSKPYKDLNRFLNAMILGGNEISQGEGVNLLTVHASKGLEFEEVYVVDLAQGRFPNIKLMNRNFIESGLEEERRLFYVAVTRAKSKLYLSYAKYDRIKKQEYQPSIFLFEAGMLKKEDFVQNEQS